MDYGNKLYDLRKNKSLSQEEVANQLGVSRQSISLWETNQASPSLENLIAFAKLFEVSLDELVGVTQKQSSSTDETAQIQNQTGDSEIILQHTKKPPLWVKLIIIPITIFWLASAIIGFELFLFVSLCYGLLLILYAIILSYNKWEANVDGHKIEVVNTPTKATLSIDGRVVEQSIVLIGSGVKLQAIFDNRSVKIYLSFLFFAKCKMDVI